LIYAGCDLGIASAKVVITENKTILANEIVPYKSFPDKAAKAAMEGALRNAGLSGDEVVSCMATGFGQKVVPFADQIDSNEICLIRALRLLNPHVKTVIDVGGHFMIASDITPDWKPVHLAKLDDCAAGTGLFIEMIAGMLEFSMEELNAGSIIAKNPVRLTNTCVGFVETEVISRINEGYSRYDVFAGITKSVAGKIKSLANKVDMLSEVAMTGGVAKYAGVTREVERYFGIKFADLNGVDPQIVAAFGAALLAEENTTCGVKPR